MGSHLNKFENQCPKGPYSGVAKILGALVQKFSGKPLNFNLQQNKMGAFKIILCAYSTLVV